MGANFGEVLNMTQTGFLVSKSGKRFIRIYFTRNGINGKASAEGIIPGYKIIKHEGFKADEVAMLEFYIKHNREEIVKKAVELSNPMNWFK